LTFLEQHPRLAELLVSLAILAGSYLGARLVSYLFEKVLLRAASRTATTLDDRLVAALRAPLTSLLFLVGAYAALHNVTLAERWAARLDSALFALAVLLMSLALVRAYGILLDWYTKDSPRAAEAGLATEFGPLFSKLGKIFIALVAVITVLQHLGVNVASLVVSLGVGSLAIGLAAQDTLANMFAGFTLMLDRPFRIGDRIALASGEVGDVEAIGIRATRIRTLDETILVVPNSVLVKERVVNQSRPSAVVTTRLDVGVAYGTDLARAKAILAESALASEYVDRGRAPLVLVVRFADFSVNLRLVFWARDCREQGLALSQVHEEIYRRFGEAGIEIPFPVRRLIREE
jgi:small-conductance mechanosensitive channel